MNPTSKFEDFESFDFYLIRDDFDGIDYNYEARVLLSKDGRWFVIELTTKVIEIK